MNFHHGCGCTEQEPATRVLLLRSFCSLESVYVSIFLRLKTRPHQQQCRGNVRLVALDNVASTLLLVWTGL